MSKLKLTLASLIQDFFTKYLQEERGFSSESISAYRDGVKLFLQYSQKTLKKPSTEISFQDVNYNLVLSFLSYLELERGNLVRSRNHRLAIIKSLVKYCAYRCPDFLGTAQQISAIPRKRGDSVMLGFLEREEIDAILSAADRNTLSGERDFILFNLMYNTGIRVSEALSLRMTDINFERQASIKINGKGRKLRQTPMWPSTAKLLRDWTKNRDMNSPLFMNRGGETLTRSGVATRLEFLVQKASVQCPSLLKKRISPHTIRHTTAMHLLKSGIDITVIAMWLGHANIKTTHGYIEADLSMKEKAMEKIQAPKFHGKKYKPADSIITFLEQL